jgi:uncharacterized protein YlzI (FlbEa/FlbD family)
VSRSPKPIQKNTLKMKDTEISFPILSILLSFGKKIFVREVIVECWYDCAAAHRRKIQIVQNKQLKIIMDSHWRHSTEALHEEAGVPLIEDFSQRILNNFFQKILFSENPLILGLINP